MKSIILTVLIFASFAISCLAQESNPLFVVIVDDKRGFIDRTGKIVLEPKWDTAGKFSEGVAWVGFDQAKREYKIGNLTFYSSPSDSFDYKFGLIDKTGKYIVEPTFTYAGDFSEGLAVVRTKEDKFGFIDKTGRIVIEPKYSGQSEFSEGLKFVILEKGEIGFIDKTGKIVLKPEFALADDFKNGLASVSDSLDIMKVKYGYIDKTGKVIWKPTR